MSIRLQKLGCTAVPSVLVGPIREVMARVKGAAPVSVYRGPEAARIINPCGSHTQQQIWDASPSQRAAWGVLGTPNPPGRSTHECRSDGVAYSGPVGRRLADWQCGMDWPDQYISQVMAAFRAIGEIPIHPYAAGVEYHHINLVRAPKVVDPFLPLHEGKRGKAKPSSGLWVYILTSRLKNCGYLKQRTSKFDTGVYDAVRLFQHHHHLAVDGIVGVHTWASLKAAERWCKQHHKTEA